MSQINIIGDEHIFNYQVEYIEDKVNETNGFKYITLDSGAICMKNIWDNFIVKESNIWISNKTNFSDNLLPKTINTSIIRLFLPKYSVDTYTVTDYALEISTYINGKRIIVGSFIFNRSECLANPYDISIDNKEYMEYIDFKIPDIKDLCYSDDWKSFRSDICGEPIDINNTGSVISVLLSPITPTQDTTGNIIYIGTNGYNAGVCGINIGNAEKDYLSATLSIENEVDETTTSLNVLLKLNFNDVYNGDIKNYIKETYNKDINVINYGIFVNNADGPLREYNINTDESTIFHEFDYSIFGFNTWNDWTPDMYIVGVIIIKTTSGDIVLRSNKIPMNIELVKYFIVGEYNIIDLKKLTSMNVHQVNVVNKLENTVVKINRPNDTKSNIMKPIFIQANALSDTIFHPEVTENICIELNGYKTSVETFYLKIEGVEFTEIGRVPAGVVFNINGSRLPNKTKEGIYYILNEDKDLVTTGKYIYMQ